MFQTRHAARAAITSTRRYVRKTQARVTLMFLGPTKNIHFLRSASDDIRVPWTRFAGNGGVTPHSVGMPGEILRMRNIAAGRAPPPAAIRGRFPRWRNLAAGRAPPRPVGAGRGGAPSKRRARPESVVTQ